MAAPWSSVMSFQMSADGLKARREAVWNPCLVEVGELTRGSGRRLSARVASRLPAVRAASVTAVLSIGDSVVGGLTVRGPGGTRFAFGRLCVVMLLDRDPCALECSASPRAAGGACLPLRLSLRCLPGLTLLWLQQGSCCTTVRHLFPGGYGQESLHASLQAESAPRAQADTCAPSIGRPVCALCERGTVALD